MKPDRQAGQAASIFLVTILGLTSFSVRWFHQLWSHHDRAITRLHEHGEGREHWHDALLCLNGPATTMQCIPPRGDYQLPDRVPLSICLWQSYGMTHRLESWSCP